MAFELQDMTGQLFPTKKENRSENAPVCSGECMVLGHKLRFKAWSNPIRNGPSAGQRYLLVRFEEIEDHSGVSDEGQDLNDDDIPF